MDALASVSARGAPQLPRHPRAGQHAVRASGPVLFARYAFGPNRLGLCGPDDWAALLQLGSSGADDRGLRELARGFEGAYPYLQLIATAAGSPDPLDARVVEAYWLGTDLVHSVGVAGLSGSLEERFRPRMTPSAWRSLAGKPDAGAHPVHAFHVLDVFPRIGLLRGGPVDDTLRVMDACRVRWGRVLEVAGPSLIVSSNHLELQAGSLVLGSPRVEPVTRWLDGSGFVDDIAAGDIVSIHWDWACDRLDQRQLRALISSTREHLKIASRTM